MTLYTKTLDIMVVWYIFHIHTYTYIDRYVSISISISLSLPASIYVHLGLCRIYIINTRDGFEMLSQTPGRIQKVSQCNDRIHRDRDRDADIQSHRSIGVQTCGFWLSWILQGYVETWPRVLGGNRIRTQLHYLGLL